jgi:pimeloyl-ACP methyl ester carboxylesterase
MVDSAYAFLQLASTRPRVARLALRVMGAAATLAPGLFVRQAGGSLPPADADLLDSEANRLAFLDMMRETLRSGPRGAQIDAALAYGPWDLPLERIGMPVDLWHGDQDRNVPVAVARYYRDRIPTARLVTFPEDGHLSILARRGPRILRALRDRMQDAAPAGAGAGIDAPEVLKPEALPPELLRPDLRP